MSARPVAGRMARTTLAASLFAATVLAGCSVGLVDTSDESTSGATTSDTTTSTSSPASSPPSSPATDDSAPDAASSTTSTAVTLATLRARFAGEVTQRISCPGGSATIEQAAVVVELAEPCDRVTVNGSGAVLLASTLGTVQVSGAAVTVVATEIDRLTLTSSSNEIYWGSGQPDIDDQGAANLAVLIPKE